MQRVSATTDSPSHELHLILHAEADGTKAYASCTDTKSVTTQGETDDLEDLVDRFSLAVWAVTRIVRSCLLGECNNGQSLPDRDQVVLQTSLAELTTKLRAESKTWVEIRVGKASEHLQVMSGLYGDKPFEIQVTTDEGYQYVQEWRHGATVLSFRPDGRTRRQTTYCSISCSSMPGGRAKLDRTSSTP